MKYSTLFTRLFIAHPRTMGESYFQHMKVAASFSAALAKAALGCLIHAVIPSLCVTTGSRAVQLLHEQMVHARVPGLHAAGNIEEDRVFAQDAQTNEAVM